MRTIRGMIILLPLSLALGTPVAGQTSSYLCSGGPRDGMACETDNDCFQSCPTAFGACVLIQGVCNGGTFDGYPCDCPGGTCSGTGDTAVCQGGAFDGSSCRTTDGDGSCGTSACVGTQKVCQAGNYQAFGCLTAAQCEGAACVSTGLFCDGGDYADYSCVENTDCGSDITGTCRAPATGCVPTACVGDCNGDRSVTIDEIVTMVNIALEISPIAGCRAGDGDGNGTITVDEIVTAVNAALGSCPA